jgi:hypothetical protein
MKTIISATDLRTYEPHKSQFEEIGFDIGGWMQALDNGDWEKMQNLETVELRIDTMEELKQFLTDHGKCVISVKYGILHIEIYNDYRE